MSNKKLVNLDYLDREAQLFKQARTNIEENTKIVREAIEKNTKEEKTIDKYLNAFSYIKLQNGERLAYCGECYNEHTFEDVSKITSSLSDCCQSSFIPHAPIESF